MGYSRDFIKGVSWIGSLSLLTKAVGFIEAIILARILSPAQFGAYAVALLALGLLETFTETGVNIVLIQEERIEDYLDSAWILSIIRGALISLILFLLSPFTSSFFHSPESLNLLYLISVVPLLRGFINPSEIKFQKELMFGKNFSFRILILIVDTILSIVITYLTKNPIGILIGLISGVILELLLSFIVISPIPKFKFNKKYINIVFDRGKWVTGSTIFDFLFTNIDNIAVGRLLGTASLGIYQMAYSLSVIPLTEIGKVFVHVTSPIFVRISEDRNRLRRAFTRNISMAFLVCLPLFLFLVVFPDFFVWILGKKWSEIAVILPVLASLGLVRSINISVTSIYISLRKQNYTTIISLFSALIFIVLIVPFIYSFGLKGAGIAGLTSSLVTFPMVCVFAYKLVYNSSQT